MILIFCPQRSDDTLTVSANGDELTLNGVQFDFSQLPDGATLPRSAIDCPWISGDVKRVDGELHIPLRLPHVPGASEAVCFPQPLQINQNGPVELPQ